MANELFSVRVTGVEGAVEWLDDLARGMGPVLTQAVRQSGERLVALAEQHTNLQDAIGASRQFLLGWRFDLPAGTRPELVGTLTNDAPHAYYAEHGRGPGRMPPDEPIRAWVRARGIDERAVFLIRRKIAREGTEGHEIIPKVMKDGERYVYDTLETALERFLMSLQ